MRIEVLDPATNTTRPLHPSASTMAQNITTSVTAGIAGTSAGSSAGSRGGADGITFGDEVERSTLLIIDQHTFEGNRNFENFEKHSRQYLSLRRLGSVQFISGDGGRGRVGNYFCAQIFYKNFIYSVIYSFMGKIEPTKMTWLPMCGFIAQLVEHRTGIHRGHWFESR